jgi:hypothetical protein
VAETKYGIKVPFDGTYIWVSQFNGAGDSVPRLFDSKKSAEEAATIWGPAAIIEEYPVDNQ